MLFQRSFILIVACFTLSCSSFMQRRSCNKTNWFDHGKSVAMKGQRLDEDAYLNNCRKVEAEVHDGELDLGFKAGMVEYCKVSTVYQTGKSGKFFNSSLCDRSQVKKLKAEHAKGVVEFCQPESAYRFGLSGQIYNKICPKKYEKAFIGKYNKGRIKHLYGIVDTHQDSIKDFERQIRGKERERRDLNLELTRLAQTGKEIKWSKTRNAETGQASESFSVAESEELKRQKSDTQSRLRSVGYEIDRYENKISDLRKKISEAKAEIRLLE